MTAQRIQRKRTKGWRMPEGAVYVGRPSRWGNPYHVGPYRDADRAFAVYLYRRWVFERASDASVARWVEPLRGRDLACWCPLDQPCHADVLLEIANR